MRLKGKMPNISYDSLGSKMFIFGDKTLIFSLRLGPVGPVKRWNNEKLVIRRGINKIVKTYLSGQTKQKRKWCLP